MEDVKTKGIEKPITMLKAELIENICTSINSSKLPMFIVEYILRDILTDVSQAAEAQEQKLAKQYRDNVNDNYKRE